MVTPHRRLFGWDDRKVPRRTANHAPAHPHQEGAPSQGDGGERWALFRDPQQPHRQQDHHEELQDGMPRRDVRTSPEAAARRLSYVQGQQRPGVTAPYRPTTKEVAKIARASYPGMGYTRPSHSALGGLPISSATACLRSIPSNRTLYVALAMGISTPRSAASLTAAAVVNTPSATFFMDA